MVSRYVVRIIHLILATTASFARREGEMCFNKVGKLSECKKVEHCPSAYENLKRGIYPEMCGYEGMNIIVCCSDRSSKIRTSDNIDSYDDVDDGDDDRIFFPHQQIPKISKSERACNRYKGPKCYEKPPLRILVVGGEEAKPKQYPHMALIGYGNREDIRWLCGGSLISEQYVLTAAHCVTTFNRGPARWVRLGELDYESTTDDANPTDYEIVDRIVHPGYRAPSIYNDVALFKLNRAVTFNEYIKPICLRRNPNLSETLIATGWGQTGVGETVSSILRTVNINLIPVKTCMNDYGTDEKFNRGIDNATMICAGVLFGGKDTCTGDSGGPLQIEMADCKGSYVQIGITSFGRSCAEAESPGVYTRVSHYVPWIENIVWK